MESSVYAKTAFIELDEMRDKDGHRRAFGRGQNRYALPKSVVIQGFYVVHVISTGGTTS